MKTRYWIFGFLLAMLFMAAGAALNGSIVQVASQPAPPGGDDHRPPPLLGPVTNAAITQDPGTRPIYFMPQDSNGTATVVILVNTDTVSHTVTVQGVNSSGTLTVHSDVILDPFERVYLLSDSLTVTSPPASWQNNVITNFTDSTNYGVLHVHPKVKFDGYVVYNPGTFVISPDQDQGALPLRFSTDPVDVFLPAVQNTP